MFRPASNGYILTAAQTAQQMGGNAITVNIDGRRASLTPRQKQGLDMLLEVAEEGPMIMRAGYAGGR